VCRYDSLLAEEGTDFFRILLMKVQRPHLELSEEPGPARQTAQKHFHAPRASRPVAEVFVLCKRTVSETLHHDSLDFPERGVESVLDQIVPVQSGHFSCGQSLLKRVPNAKEGPEQEPRMPPDYGPERNRFGAALRRVRFESSQPRRHGGGRQFRDHRPDRALCDVQCRVSLPAFGHVGRSRVTKRPSVFRERDCLVDNAVE